MSSLSRRQAIPTELREEEGELRKLIEYDGARHAAPGSLDDEYARTLRGERLAKVCVCTSRDPSSRLKQFAKELKHIVPNATRVNRGNTRVGDLVDATRRGEFTDLVMVHETRGQPDGLVVCHLPLGPTTYFTLSNCVLRHDIDAPPPFSSDAPPHLVFHDFDGGKRLEAPQDRAPVPLPVPKADAKRVCTFYNAADRISFRHHTYERDGPDVHLTELGPRFEMTPCMIKLGTLDQADADAIMIMTVPPELEERVTKFWELHAKWMAYARVDEAACLFYHVCKGPEVEDFTSGPAAKKTGNVTFTITEFYAKPAGLDAHFAMFAAGRGDGRSSSSSSSSSSPMEKQFAGGAGGEPTSSGGGGAAVFSGDLGVSAGSDLAIVAAALDAASDIFLP
ncbi:hypothetical protein JL722_15190 [Aureococcus anophagefferens]|nr:hypothetical protein JL722_15190 [Aureococcus anophagefferens]